MAAKFNYTVCPNCKRRVTVQNLKRHIRACFFGTRTLHTADAECTHRDSLKVDEDMAAERGVSVKEIRKLVKFHKVVMPGPRKPPRKCRLCERPMHARGLCGIHYRAEKSKSVLNVSRYNEASPGGVSSTAETLSSTNLVGGASA